LHLAELIKGNPGQTTSTCLGPIIHYKPWWTIFSWDILRNLGIEHIEPKALGMWIKDLVKSLRLAILDIGTLTSPFNLRTDIFKEKVFDFIIHIILLLSFEVFIACILFRDGCSPLLDLEVLFLVY
jgi:hypothetical protein